MKITRHTELEVFQRAFKAAMQVFELSKSFPKDEMYSLTDQVRRSSRSVAANITEAWRKRRYEAAFISKLSDAETEAAETQTWLLFAERCGYLADSERSVLDDEYEVILRMLVSMAVNAKKWTL
ncbi:four helix bundle protein [Prosthecobacter sp.]|uniref:four helix bundle protein n=1 Tax=Prosthecobacter sp. TaxID=1965333 RepID=UPI002ABABF23|nr:four helix bundle protein [Prosthecobacter sp.]MDZ4404886.1 four helix bundle protein [Prosthecobacter sp.]